MCRTGDLCRTTHQNGCRHLATFGQARLLIIVVPGTVPSDKHLSMCNNRHPSTIFQLLSFSCPWGCWVTCTDCNRRCYPSHQPQTFHCFFFSQI